MDRRTFLRQSAAALAASTSGRAWGAALAPTAARRTAPVAAYGVAAGLAGPGRAVIWSRCDRPARMFVEWSTTESFAAARTVRGPAALESSDGTARVLLTGLPPGQRVFYRVRFQDLGDLRVWSEPVAGQLSTALETAARDVRIVWSADTVGQGWGINPDFGGLRLYDPMLQADPDLFIHCGDTIYADQPLQPEVTLDDGGLWRNVVTPAKAKVAESLDEFRGNYQYNLQDLHMQRFNARVAQAALWDDHEVRDNWYPTRDLSRDDRYVQKSMAILAARARQAFAEYHPLPVGEDDPERVYRTVAAGPLVEVFALDLRSYRGPNSNNRQATLTDDSRIMGAAQVAWLVERLSASKATWKIVANDMPIGLVVRDGPQDFEAVANGDSGPPLGRELEIAEILRALKARRVRNVVWITGDVHYCAAHHYDPARARFTDFDPFWEFVAGPLHAGSFAPGTLDATFGPEVRFTGTPAGLAPNRPPSAGFQFFGQLQIAARTHRLTVSLHNLSGARIYSMDLEAAR